MVWDIELSLWGNLSSAFDPSFNSPRASCKEQWSCTTNHSLIMKYNGCNLQISKTEIIWHHIISPAIISSSKMQETTKTFCLCMVCVITYKNGWSCCSDLYKHYLNQFSLLCWCSWTFLNVHCRLNITSKKHKLKN